MTSKVSIHMNSNTTVGMQVCFVLRRTHAAWMSDTASRLDGAPTAVERIWHKYGSHGQIMVLA